VAEVLCWHACCGCDLGADWAEAVLSYRLQISESLAKDCEAVGEARPPRSVAEISGCIGARRELSVDAWLEQGNQRPYVCGLRLKGPWWRSSSCRFGLLRVATLAVIRRW
jgi:hypothetical protein